MHRQSVVIGSRDNLIRRTGRVLDIIWQITTAPCYWSRKKLALHYEISERMITKDMEYIKILLGAKLLHENGGYRFDGFPRLPTQAYSFSEALALILAARTAQAVPGVNSAELAAAIARLESVFPASLRPLLRDAAQTLPERAIHSQRQEMLALLHRALVEKRQVEVRYRSTSREQADTPRVLEPYQLLPYGRSWHLAAFDHRRKEVRLFKIDRFLEAALLDTRYSIPADFDLDSYLGDGWGLMRGDARAVEEVSLLFSPPAARWVVEEEWHKSQRSEILADGFARLRFTVRWTPEMVSWLLYYGEYVQVEYPAELATAVRERHRKAAGIDLNMEQRQ